MTMQSVLATLWASIITWAASSTSKLIASITAQIGQWTTDERQILLDAKTKFTQDVAAGQSVTAAAADALTLFYNEEKGEVHKAGLFIFQAFLADFGVPQG
jgi:uncharacterized protein (DUF2345 family)